MEQSKKWWKQLMMFLEIKLQRKLQELLQKLPRATSKTIREDTTNR